MLRISYSILVQIILNLDDFLFWWEHFLQRKKKNESLTKKFGDKMCFPNLRQAKSGAISFSVVMEGGGVVSGEKITVALKNVLILEFFF